jgi:hypothetical protein
LSLCPPAAGSRVWDFGIDARLAYDVVCKDVSSAGQLPTGQPPLTWAYDLNDIPDNLDDLQNQAQLAQTLLPVNVCTGVNLPSILQNGAMQRRLAELESFGHISDDDFLLIDMAYATYGLSDLVRAPDKLNGQNPFTTAGVSYSDAAINAGIARISADPFAALYFQWASDFRGRIAASTRIVSIHTSHDELVIPANQSVLRRTVPAAQLTSAIVSEATPTHCGFNTAEGLAAWEALRAWIAGGAQPQVSTLQSDCQAAVAGGSGGPCRFDASITPPSFDSQVAPRPASTAPNVDARYSGAWYDPARSGEGIELEILPNNQAGIYFFTYPPKGTTGGQAWVYGIGDIVGNGIEFANILRPLRDAQGHVTQQPWGRIALTFSDCNTGGMRWDGPSGWGSMEVPLARLTALQGLSCSSSGSGPTQASGAWYDPSQSGNGFLLEQLDSQHLGAFYFGLDTDGTQSWANGILGAGADGSYSGNLQQATGTQFGAGFDPTKISRNYAAGFSNLNLSCATGTAHWQIGFGLVQTLSLQRLTVPAGVAACQP